DAGNATPGMAKVGVLFDTKAPAITAVTATPSTVWPPNGSMVPVSIAIAATDNVDDAPSCGVSSVTSAPSAAAGDVVLGSATALSLKAVGGRTYTVNVRCADA